MSKVEFIPVNREKVCFCDGKNINCKLCDGTGKYLDISYMLIAGKNGFMVDTLK